jgi:PIN domain nuclease of toxin-antitoxin system
VIVIDTHVCIWWVDSNPRLKPAVRTRLDTEVDVRVSAISLLEIAIACSLKRLTLLPTPREWLAAARGAAQVRIEPLTGQLTGSLCLQSVDLPGQFHRDPGDRLIAAPARTLDAELVTADDKILRYAGVRAIAAA